MASYKNDTKALASKFLISFVKITNKALDPKIR